MEKGHQHRGKFTEGLLNNDVILEALNIQEGQTILDAGCGNGYMSKLFSESVSKSGKVFALDPDKYFIKMIFFGINGQSQRVQRVLLSMNLLNGVCLYPKRVSQRKMFG